MCCLGIRIVLFASYGLSTLGGQGRVAFKMDGMGRDTVGSMSAASDGLLVAWYWAPCVDQGLHGFNVSSFADRASFKVAVDCGAY